MRVPPAALLFVLVTGAYACGASGPEPCLSASTCPRGEACLANRCVTAGSSPVHPETRRLVLEPVEVAVVSGHPAPADALAGSVAFGSTAGGRTSLFLRFEPRWRGQQLQTAFLLLEPMPGTVRTDRDVPVEAWRVRDAWKRDVDPLRPPGLSPPRAAGLARSGPALPLRIDVTEIVRWLDRHPRSDHGLALSANSVDEHGATFATGATVGTGPRLELYVR